MKIFSTVIPYLLLVSFYTGTISNFGINKINAINISPYNGVAVMLTGAYETGDFRYEEIKDQISLLKNTQKKIYGHGYFLIDSLAMMKEIVPYHLLQIRNTSEV